MLELLLMIFVIGIMPFIVLYAIGLIVNNIVKPRGRR